VTWSTGNSPGVPQSVVVTDVTERPTREGKVYCGVVLDTFVVA
jgi:hypothetical protein